MEDKYYVIVFWTKDYELNWIIQDYHKTFESKSRAERELKELIEDQPFGVRYTLVEIIKPS